MLCLLPSTALALSGFDPADVPNASGLFNLMRNLGGAIGLALIDTVLEQRTPAHIASIVAPAGGRSVGGPSGWPADRALHRRADRRGRRSDARPGGAIGRACRVRRRLQRCVAADLDFFSLTRARETKKSQKDFEATIGSAEAMAVSGIGPALGAPSCTARIPLIDR
jgi:hypothetical protein